MLVRALADRITVPSGLANIEPNRLTKDQAEAAGNIIAAAFFASPVAAFLFPDPDRRAQLHPPFFAAMTRLVVRSGEATGLGAPLHAVALWLPPGREHPAEAEYLAAGMGEAAADLDEAEAARIEALNHHLDATHERVMGQPHWYLPFLGVAPGHQGQGAGTVLMRHQIGRIAPTGVPCYLESADAANVPFYERLGFRVVEIATVPGSQLRTWALRRD